MSGNSFLCACGAGTRVIDSRPTKQGIRRRRVCLTGNAHRFTTWERAESDDPPPVVAIEDLAEVRISLNRILARKRAR